MIRATHAPRAPPGRSVTRIWKAEKSGYRLAQTLDLFATRFVTRIAGSLVEFDRVILIHRQARQPAFMHEGQVEAGSRLGIRLQSPRVT